MDIYLSRFDRENIISVLIAPFERYFMPEKNDIGITYVCCIGLLSRNYNNLCYDDVIL